MNEIEKSEAQFNEKDIEQIFGGDAVLGGAEDSRGNSARRAVQQTQRQTQQVVSDNLS